MEDVGTKRCRDLARLNAPGMASWLVESACQRGVRCGHSSEQLWSQHWRGWSKFCDMRGSATYPIQLANVEAFIVDCALRGRKLPTVQKYLRTLKAVVDSVDAVDPMATEDGKARLERTMTVYFPESGAWPQPLWSGGSR